MKKISLISVYNNQQLLDEMVASAKKQKNVEVELITIDNTNKRFSSASKALNYGTDKATGDVLVFLHQDIEFMNDDVLEFIYDYATENKTTVFGSAGVNDKGTDKNVKILTAMYGYEGENKTIDKPTKALTLDECLIACHQSCMKKLRFDENICDGWHLYGADLCLQAIDFAGMFVYAVPMNVWHKSGGCADTSYFDTQDKLAEKYKKYHTVINTTNSFVYTNPFKRKLARIYRKLRYKV